ncbi:Hsp70 family protein [Pseudonocardia hispaniensis]|uniref:Hsp70 family protein n=1 Tax=Pseudonocardia hispaniensis TaxID=904933 RepID=A0ABW1IYV8_9PSEU
MTAPAVVHLREDGTIVTGAAANRRALSNPERIGRGLRRYLGDPTPVILGGASHSVTDLMGHILRDVVRTVVDAEGGPPDDVVLTRPASWNPTRYRLLDQVAAIAGLHRARTVVDPEASAAHFAQTRRPRDGEIVAVYDLGGGTFDAAVLIKRPYGMELLGDPEGIERLGGIDFDETILSYVDYRTDGALSRLDLQDQRTAGALARLRQDCALAKEALTGDTETTVPVLLPDRHLDVRITRAEFENMLRAPVEATLGALARALRSARVTPRDLAAVLLTGGCTRIPMVARAVQAEFGVAVVRLHPDHATALGAAALAARSALAAAERPGPPAPWPTAPTFHPPRPEPGPPPPPTPRPAPAQEHQVPPWPPGPTAPEPSEKAPSGDGDWRSASIGRMLVIGVALLAAAVLVAVVTYFVILRLRGDSAGTTPRSLAVAAVVAAPPRPW